MQGPVWAACRCCRRIPSSAAEHYGFFPSWEAQRRRAARRGHLTLLLLILSTTCPGLAASAGNDTTTTFTILHVNDIHGRVLPADRYFQECEVTSLKSQFDTCFGGYARIGGVVRAIRAAGPTLLLNAGDEVSGTLFSYFYNGKESWTYLNQIGFDAMNLGQHEFDKGPIFLADYIGNLTVPVTTCNVQPKPQSVLYGKLRPGPLITNLTVPDASNGSRIVRVGIVSWSSTTVPEQSSPGPDIEFLPLVPSVTKCVQKLESAGVDIIIGLGHAGVPEDGLDASNDLTVAANVPGLDVVVGGNSHTFMYSGSPPLLNLSRNTSADKPAFPYPLYVQATYDAEIQVPYVQAMWGGRYLGRLKVTFDAEGRLKSIDPSSNPILLGGPWSSSDVPFDGYLMYTSILMSEPLSELESSVVGSSSVALTRPFGEQNLGNLVCDAMLWEVESKLENLVEKRGPVNLCFMNSGGIRYDLPKGNISLGGILSALPFGNLISVKSFNGSELLSALDFSVKGDGGFLQLSGLSIAFDGSLPRNERKLLDAKLLDATTGCLRPIDPAATYNFVCNDFLAVGGDSSAQIGGAQYLLKTGRVLSEVVVEYLARFSPVSPKVEGRIQNVATSDFTPRPTCDVDTQCSLTPASYSCMTPQSAKSSPEKILPSPWTLWLAFLLSLCWMLQTSSNLVLH